MLFSTREICDVVLRAKSAQKIGNKVFYKNEPVIYFDSLKTSSLEEQTTTVYAQGGRGNARLIAWEGEKTVTFVMEDALLSPEGFSILSGAGLVHASENESIIVHKTEITNKVKWVSGQSGGSAENTYEYLQIILKEKPYKTPSRAGINGVNSKEDFIYVMLLDDKGEIISEPYIASEIFKTGINNSVLTNIISIENGIIQSDDNPRINDLSKFTDGCQVLVDYYVEKKSDTFEIDITPDKFSGNFYLEASTLFRTINGQDIPAQFVIPNCKIQSNFTFTMASSGDPSTFTFTIDAFPDYTRWNKNKKVFAAIQIIEDNEVRSNLERLGTPHNYKSENRWDPLLTYTNEQAQYIEEEPPAKIINMIFDSKETNGEIYNDGLGYKKGYYLTNGLEAEVNTASGSEFSITGFIPYNYNENISMIGFKPKNNIQGIYFYNENFEFIYYKNAKDFENSYRDLKEEKSYTYKLDSENEDILSNEDKESIEYIRICFKNTDIRNMAVIVYGELQTYENE